MSPSQRSRPHPGGSWRDWGLDLATGSSCVGCEAPGRLLCRSCETELHVEPFPAPPDPRPPGLVTPWASGAYAGVRRDLIVGHKEHGWTSLTPVLGQLLARAVIASVGQGVSLRSGLVLVPVPSRRASVRTRGRDPTRALVEIAARLSGAHVAPLLTLRPGVVDQAGLDTAERAGNLHEAMRVDPRHLRRLAAHTRRAIFIVCDDVVTTGATLMEAQRALSGVGLPPIAHATVAATRRRARTPDSDQIEVASTTTPGEMFTSLS